MDNGQNIVGKIVEGYKIIKFLGRGKFSTVYQAERQKDHKLVALKIIKIYDIGDKKTIDKCLQEVNLLQKVSHPNIVKYLDSFISQNELYIAIEWADKGDVKRLIKKYKQEGDLFEEARVIEYTREIASALNHMHEKRVIHRDLKPANILIFSDGTFKLGDLGLGRFMSAETFKTFSRVGTPLYMAPEVINNNGYDFKSDNWSLGCVVFELITLKSPFQTDEKISMMDLFKKISVGQYPHIKDEKYPVSSKIVESLLKVNPEERIELSEVIKQCEAYLAQQEEKPRIDPFIVMDDIIEKLRLINYENNFCIKYNKEVITKYYFACSIYGYEHNDAHNSEKETYPIQFSYFFDLCNWLMIIIKQNVKLELLPEFNLKFKKYDKKKSHENQINELISDLKSMEVKVLQNSKFKYGYGEGVCLVLTQLCDKYLIKQNFIFKRPKFQEQQVQKTEEFRNDFDRIPLEEHIGTNIGFKSNTNYNFGNNFKSSGSSNTKFFSGCGKKRFNSAFSVGDDTTVATDFSVAEDDPVFKQVPSSAILQATIEPVEWKKEFLRVENILEIPEVPEILESQSESSTNNLNNANPQININLSSNLSNDLKITKRIGHAIHYINNIEENFKDMTKFYCEGVDRELKKISTNEKSLSQSQKVKDIILKVTNSKKGNGFVEDNAETLKESINNLDKEKEKIHNRLEKIKEEELEIEEKKELSDDKKMKKVVENLKNEITKYETEIALYNTTNFNQLLSKIRKDKEGVLISNFSENSGGIDFANSGEIENESPVFDEENL